MRSSIKHALSVAVLGLLLSACSDSDNDGFDNGSNGGGNNQAIPFNTSEPTVAVAESRAGTIYRQDVPVDATGETMVIQVFEPSQLEVGESYPLVLHSHGYGGRRHETADGFVQRLIDSGYYVISIDQRGFGASGGQVRVQSPDFEGPNLVAILDWAENLEGLARRGDGQMLVGSYGGSYGGMYQMLLYLVDPLHRLRVLAPDIMPHDLTYSLNPHGVVKSGWGLGLIANGEAPLLGLATGGDPSLLITNLEELLARGNSRQDPAIIEILLNAGVSNEFSEAGFNFMRYHSVKYFCDGLPAGPQDFMFASPDPMLVPPELPPPADILFTQGFLDTLFNFNDGVGNYECLKANGGDVRLLTHQSGHILPVSLDAAGLEDPLDPFFEAVTVPEFQDGGGSRSCGSIELDELQFAWFEEKLKGKNGSVNAVLSTGDDVCLSLAEGDAIAVDSVKRGGTDFEIDASNPQLNSLLGVVGSLLGNAAREALLATQPLMTVGEGGGVIAGIPLLDVEITGLSGMEQDECPAPLIQLACDPIYYLAIGHRPAGQTRYEPLDGQITPIRDFGPHQIEMNGIAERLQEGDELALLIYGFHAQFPVTFSRDVFVPAANFSGTLSLPLLSPAEIKAEGL
ncbi:MAG: CocE/NonD family hydrolase [Salinisphaeraceae bacterium]|nr:CocE/NonD family hydrolase [Salinisphaeraceae bacterium]